MQDRLRDLQHELTALQNKQNALWMERTRLTLELRISTNGTYIVKKNRIASINNELRDLEISIENIITKIRAISP